MDNGHETADYDVVIEFDGSMFRVNPVTREAEDWVSTYVNIEPHMRAGPFFFVEYRYMQPIIDGMLEHGLRIKS